MNIQFLSTVLVSGVLCATSAIAAPSVRMLGTGASAARIGTNATVVKADTSNTASTQTQRLGSVRSKNILSGTPVTVNKVASANSATASDAESRLSLGKYIHTTGVASGSIKPASGATAGVSSSDFTSLADRVSSLENNVDSKQEALTPGEGLALENNTIALDESITALPDQVSALQTAMSNNFYTKEEVNSYVQEIVQAGGTTYNSTTSENSYDTIEVADEFDEEGFSFTD